MILTTNEDFQGLVFREIKVLQQKKLLSLSLILAITDNLGTVSLSLFASILYISRFLPSFVVITLQAVCCYTHAYVCVCVQYEEGGKKN